MQELGAYGPHLVDLWGGPGAFCAWRGRRLGVTPHIRRSMLRVPPSPASAPSIKNRLGRKRTLRTTPTKVQLEQSAYVSELPLVMSQSDKRMKGEVGIHSATMSPDITHLIQRPSLTSLCSFNAWQFLRTATVSGWSFPRAFSRIVRSVGTLFHSVHSHSPGRPVSLYGCDLPFLHYQRNATRLQQL